MRFALNSLAVVAGDWLLEHSDEAWLHRYGHRVEERRLPQSQASRLAVAETIGQDGWRLLTDLFDEAAPAFLREIPAVKILRQVWVQNYRYDDGQLHWREPSDIPPATLFINSPYDQEARYGKKYSTRWTGYKVHLTETCEADQPHLIIHVATTPAPESDVSMTEAIQADLQQAQMLPSHHLLDTGYVNADVLAKSQQRFGIEVISPTHPDVKWQANTDHGIDASQFVIDWERKQATCPQGQTSVSWTPTCDSRHHEVIKIRFSTKDCQVCPVVSLCTSSKSRAPRRLVSVRPQQQYEALQAARKLQATKEFSEQYALRQGIEATISEASASLWLTSLSLYWLGQDPSPASWHSCSYQHGSRGCMVRWRRTRSHTRFGFPEALRCGLGGFPNSVNLGEC